MFETAEFVNPNEYQQLADRTKSDQTKALNKISRFPESIQLLHSVIGLMGELGELAGNLERWLWYGQPFDKANFKEELGDAHWYLAEAHNALEIKTLETMRSNIRKLKSRYPDQFTTELSEEENRDREKEREEVKDKSRPWFVGDRGEQNGQGWGEPPEVNSFD